MSPASEWTGPSSPAPVLGDPVVIHGEKLRVRTLTAGGALELRPSFAQGLSGLRVYRMPDELTWDPIGRVWRDRRAYR